MFEHALKTRSDLPNVWISLAEYILSKGGHEKCLAILKASIASLKSSTMLYKVAQFLLTNDISTDIISDNLLTISLVDATSVIDLLKLCLDNDISSEPDLALFMGRALNEFPGNKELWIFQVQNLSIDIATVYKEAISSVTDNIELWQGYLRYMSITESTDVCKAEWQTGLKSTAGPKLAPLYFEWLYAEEGLASVREEYQAVTGLYPLSEDMILTRVKLEEAEQEYGNMFTLFEALCTGFDSAKNWTMFITLCRDQFPEKLTSVMWKAKSSVGEEGLGGLK